MYIEITFEEINELMRIAEEYNEAWDESPEKARELEEKLRRYEEKFRMPIFFDENLGEYPAIVIDENNVWIDVTRDIIVRIGRDRVSIEASAEN
jgi:hypothetical protein